MITQQALEVAKTLARMAAERILLYHNAGVASSQKDDPAFKSPVTQADLDADAIITHGLSQAYPDHAVLTEESTDNDSRIDAEYVWIVDPLDGTKEFVNNLDEFTVNIALLHNNKPLLGVIAVPAKDEMYYAIVGEGAWKKKGKNIVDIHASRERDPKKMIMVRSRSHAGTKEQALFDKAGFKEQRPSGSSVKGCLVAAGEAHVYPRFGRVMEWDVCAMAAILEAAGATITDLDGQPLKWNKKNPEVLGFIASNNTIHKDIVRLAHG